MPTTAGLQGRQHNPRRTPSVSHIVPDADVLGKAGTHRHHPPGWVRRLDTRLNMLVWEPPSR